MLCCTARLRDGDRVDVVLTAERPLTEAEVVAVARSGARVELSAECLERLVGARAHVDELAACDRIRLRCSCVRSSTGMCRVASAPKPVEMP